jgi:uncharacterized protein YecE (DUF72 family)
MTNTVIQEFVDNWKDSGNNTKTAFTEILDHLNTLENTRLDFNARPGVSYSLRPVHAAQKDKPLFAMVDVIDDDPEDRWLSVCFYGEMITDPDETGDLVPEGLMGEDGYCFDLYAYDADELSYIKARLTQAHGNAAE